MVTLAPRLKKIHSQSSVGSMMSEHKVASTAGVLFFLLAAIGVVTFLPDIMRYIRMKRM